MTKDGHMSRTIIRLIGETDIFDIDPASHDGGAHPKLMGLDADDRVNLLGHWLIRTAARHCRMIPISSQR